VLAPYLWPLLAQYVLPYRETEGSLVSHYSYFSREYEPSDLVNFRLDSLRDPYALGQSPTQAAFAFVGLSDSYAALMENLLTQSVRPSVIVTNTDPEEPFGEAERRRLQREINYQLSAGGAGKAWVVDGSIDVKSLNVPPTSLAENEISETAIKYVSFIFGVPLSFLRNEDSNRAVAEAGHYQHAKLGVEPRCVNIASTLTKWTHSEGRRRGQDWSRLLWAFDNPVKDDEEREAQVFDLRLRSGAVTINEYRTHLGYSAVPWGDEPWMANSLVQPSQAQENRDLDRASHDDSIDPTSEVDDSADDDDEEETEEHDSADPTAKGLNPRANRGGNAVECRDATGPTGADDEWWDREHSSGWNDTPPCCIRKGKRRRKPKGRGKKPASSRGRRGKKPKPGGQSASSTAGSGEVIEIPPAGGRGNALHYLHGSRFAPANAGQSPATSPPAKPKKRRGKVKKAEHNYANKQEQRVAGMLGGKWLSDHEPMDVIIKALRLHGIEVKTLLKGRRRGITMHADALLRKVEWRDAGTGRVVHTIVIDHRDRYYGGKYKGKYSGHEIYYKRGAGSFALSQMHQVASVAELKELITIPNHKLPDAARGSLPSGENLIMLQKRAAKVRVYNANRAHKYRQPNRRARKYAPGKE
ncbi:MAG: phage portal protein, partial [Isosphaeraceae bacterium]|nr:phage portal protein [Isosphaeraceae bacterium]